MSNRPLLFAGNWIAFLVWLLMPSRALKSDVLANLTIATNCSAPALDDSDIDALFTTVPQVGSVTSAKEAPVPIGADAANPAPDQSTSGSERPRLILLGTSTSESEVKTPLLLRTFGNHSAVGVSVAYDVERLQLVGVDPAPGLEPARLEVNTSQSDKGRVGIALALLTGTIPEGLVELASLSFRVQGNPTGTTVLRFVDDPVFGEIADKTANPIPFDTTSGVISFYADSAGVRISTTRAGSALLLSWPTSAKEFELFSTDDPAGSTWARVQAPILELKYHFIATLPAAEHRVFYRLVRP